ncbi:MAG TPA: universal stress protein [Methylocella sp.]|nr:universal stress protein [Methylocella sp.]
MNAAACSAPLITETAAQLSSLASEEGANLIVAGAYGRKKLREWVFGGVTRELLRQTSRGKPFPH